MFRYFGKKGLNIKYYQKPEKGLMIIEPFCGTSSYACSFHQRAVWINDSYIAIYDIWKWIQQASRKDILDLPQLPYGSSINKCTQLSMPEKLILGFCNQWASVRPHDFVTRASIPALQSLKRKLIGLCGGIDHWLITNLDYREIPNQKACWFIDPPYKYTGESYSESEINYKKLARWCRERHGQVQVCENDKAKWLPFSNLFEFVSQGGTKRVESVWTNFNDSGSTKLKLTQKKKTKKKKTGDYNWAYPTDGWRAPKGTATRSINAIFIENPNTQFTNEQILRISGAPRRLVQARLSNLTRWGWISKSKNGKYKLVILDEYIRP